MRGPLLSGAIGRPAVLERLAQILRARPPAVVLSSLWLASELSAVVPLLVLVEPDVAASARRALRRAARDARALLPVIAGESLPLGDARVGALVIESLVDIEPAEVIGFLVGLIDVLSPGGVLVSLDATKDPATEARVAGAFLAAGLTHIAQERPREGALLTIGGAPLPAVRRVLREDRPRAGPSTV